MSCLYSPTKRDKWMTHRCRAFLSSPGFWDVWMQSHAISQEQPALCPYQDPPSHTIFLLECTAHNETHSRTPSLPSSPSTYPPCHYLLMQWPPRWIGRQQYAEYQTHASHAMRMPPAPRPCIPSFWSAQDFRAVLSLDSLFIRSW